jgi:hypothetical protein
MANPTNHNATGRPDAFPSEHEARCLKPGPPMDYPGSICMSKAKLYSVVLAVAVASGYAQQNDPSSKPNVFLENKSKPPKPSSARTISGIVKDESDNPVRGAIVQLKDLKSSKIVDFATKDDGKFAFKELYMDVNYELTAKHDGITSAVKKVSPYDTRRDVVLNFRLEPPK